MSSKKNSISLAKKYEDIIAISIKTFIKSLLNRTIFPGPFK